MLRATIHGNDLIDFGVGIIILQHDKTVFKLNDATLCTYYMLLTNTLFLIIKYNYNIRKKRLVLYRGHWRSE